MIPRNKYLEILKVMPRPCVDCVIMYKGMFLLGHRSINPDKCKWGLIGGMVKMGETTEEAVVRKCKEEAGINVDINNVKLLGIFTCFGETRQDICMTYKVEVDKPNGITLDYQHDNYCWANKATLPNNMNQFALKQIELLGDN